MHKNNILQTVAGGHAVTAAIFLIFAFLLGGCSNPNSINGFTKSHSNENNHESNPIPIEVSAKQAIEIACGDAKSFIPEPLVEIINSTDDTGESSKSDTRSGTDGKRRVIGGKTAGDIDMPGTGQTVVTAGTTDPV